MSAREWPELALACACHLVMIVVLRVARFRTLLRLSQQRLPPSRHPLSWSQLRRVASLSRRLCGGTCLTESLVLKLLVARHDVADVPLTIGVSLAGGVFHAHAWTGVRSQGGEFVPIWSDARSAESQRPADLWQPDETSRQRLAGPGGG